MSHQSLPNSQHTPTLYIKGFDGMRAVSIIMVMLTHLGVYDAWLQQNFTLWLWHTLSGEVGVNIFFVISGFLITTLLLREKSEKGKISYRNFIIRRFLRLLPPLILFYFTLFILRQTGQLHYTTIGFLASVFYIYNFLPFKFGSPELGHTWSLAVEEQFYFLWPWIIYLFSRKGILNAVLLIILLSLIAIYVVPDLHFVYQNKTIFMNTSFKPERFFLPAIAPIMIGSAFAVFNFYDAAQLKSIVCKPLSMLLAVLLMLSAFIIPVSCFNYLFLLQAAGFALLLAYIFHQQDSPLTKILEWKPLAFIGKISYGIYVWQGLFLRTGQDGAMLWIQNPPQNIALTFAVAVTSYFLIEKNVMKWKRRFRSE